MFFSLPPWGKLGVPTRNRPVTLARTLLCRLALIVRLRHWLTVSLPFRLAVILGLPRPNLALVLPLRLVTGAGHPCPNLAVRLTLISPSWPRVRARTGHQTGFHGVDSTKRGSAWKVRVKNACLPCVPACAPGLRTNSANIANRCRDRLIGSCGECGFWGNKNVAPPIVRESEAMNFQPTPSPQRVLPVGRQGCG